MWLSQKKFQGLQPSCILTQNQWAKKLSTLFVPRTRLKVGKWNGQIKVNEADQFITLLFQLSQELARTIYQYAVIIDTIGTLGETNYAKLKCMQSCFI